MPNVTVGDECPSLVCAVLTSTPPAINAVADIDRKSWLYCLRHPRVDLSGTQIGSTGCGTQRA
jgi:hypothetical protein